jgi:hypothetical protein
VRINALGRFSEYDVYTLVRVLRDFPKAAALAIALAFAPLNGRFLHQCDLFA